MLWVHTNVRIGIVHTHRHVSVFCSSFCTSVRCFCSSVCASYNCISLWSSFYLPSVHLSDIPSVCLYVCLSVCMYVHMYLCRDERTSVWKLNWLDWYLVWLESSLDTHFIWVFFFVSRFKRRHCRYVHLFYAKTVFTIAKKVHIYLWAIALYYTTSRLWQWRKVNPKPLITFYNCKICWYPKLWLKHIMTSLSDPLSLIEHELYVENAVWILHTLSTRECSSNERLGPRGGGGGTLIFSYKLRLWPFLGLKI